MGLRILSPAVIFIAVVFYVVSTSADEPAPNIHFDETEHDFGTIEQMEEYIHIFRFKNVGNGVLNIEKVRATCGCTAALVSSKEISPQGSGELKVTFDSGLYEDRVTKDIYIHTNDPHEPIVKLQIKATVRTAATLIPRRLNLGKIVEGTGVTKQVKVLLNEKDLKITKVESTSEYISAKLSKLSVVENKLAGRPTQDPENRKGFMLEVTLSPEAKAGRLFGTVSLHTNKTKPPVLHVPVHVDILGEVVLQPEVLAFGAVQKGSTASRKILVTETKEKDLVIWKVESSLDWLSTEVLVLEKGKKYEVNVVLGPDAPLGRSTGKVTIHTNSEKLPVLTVSVHVIIRDDRE